MAPHSRSFIDLPLEIRYMIYREFECIRPFEYILPASKNAVANKERAEILQGRRSLQLVNRQMNVEWTPQFYAGTTIALKDNNIQQFKAFLESDRAHNVRKVKCLTITAALATMENTWGLEQARFLRNIAAERLPNLEEVSVLTEGWETHTLFCEKKQFPYNFEWQWNNGQCVEIWADIEDGFREGSQGGPLHGWSINRAEIWDRKRPFATEFWMNRMLVFTKKPQVDTPNTIDFGIGLRAPTWESPIPPIIAMKSVGSLEDDGREIFCGE